MQFILANLTYILVYKTTRRWGKLSGSLSLLRLYSPIRNKLVNCQSSLFLVFFYSLANVCSVKSVYACWIMCAVTIHTGPAVTREMQESMRSPVIAAQSIIPQLSTPSPNISGTSAKPYHVSMRRCHRFPVTAPQSLCGHLLSLQNPIVIPFCHRYCHCVAPLFCAQRYCSSGGSMVKEKNAEFEWQKCKQEFKYVKGTSTKEPISTSWAGCYTSALVFGGSVSLSVTMWDDVTCGRQGAAEVEEVKQRVRIPFGNSALGRNAALLHPL